MNEKVKESSPITIRDLMVQNDSKKSARIATTDGIQELYFAELYFTIDKNCNSVEQAQAFIAKVKETKSYDHYERDIHIAFVSELKKCGSLLRKLISVRHKPPFEVLREVFNFLHYDVNGEVTPSQFLKDFYLYSIGLESRINSKLCSEYLWENYYQVRRELFLVVKMPLVLEFLKPFNANFDADIPPYEIGEYIYGYTEGSGTKFKRVIKGECDNSQSAFYQMKYLELTRMVTKDSSRRYFYTLQPKKTKNPI